MSYPLASALTLDLAATNTSDGKRHAADRSAAASASSNFRSTFAESVPPMEARSAEIEPAIVSAGLMWQFSCFMAERTYFMGIPP
jgi:hypothetical protein